jgi:hypothetical protein
MQFTQPSSRVTAAGLSDAAYVAILSNAPLFVEKVLSASCAGLLIRCVVLHALLFVCVCSCLHARACAAASPFALQASLFPDSYFVIGFDTAVRLVNPKYYGDDPFRMHDALSFIQRAGCRCEARDVSFDSASFA